MAKTKEELKEYNRLYIAKKRAEGFYKPDPAQKNESQRKYLAQRAGEGFKTKIFNLIPEDVLVQYESIKPENITDVEFFTLLIQNYKA